MATSAFDNKSKKPTEIDVATVLGSKSKLWEAIKRHVTDNYGVAIQEWKFYSAKWGWSMKYMMKKRNLFFFGPREGFFIITFIFGDKAVAEIEKSDLPKAIIEEIVNARKYMEGRGISIEVKKKNDVENILKLINIKINN
jgi:hypothetical protein